MKLMPVSDGKVCRSFAYASKPPAEAPTATTDSWWGCSSGVARAGKGDLPERERADPGLVSRDSDISCFAFALTDGRPSEKILAVPVEFRLLTKDLRRDRN